MFERNKVRIPVFESNKVSIPMFGRTRSEFQCLEEIKSEFQCLVGSGHNSNVWEKNVKIPLKEIFSQIRDKSEHVNYLLANRDVTTWQISCFHN